MSKIRNPIRQLVFTALCLSFLTTAGSAATRKVKQQKTAPRVATNAVASGNVKVTQLDPETAEIQIMQAPVADPNFMRAKKFAASGQYQDASRLLFQMSRSSQYEKDAAQIKYVLGLMLYELKLNQSAAFVFYDLIRQEGRSGARSKYLRLGLSKLAMAADSLDSDVLLRYAMKQVDEAAFPSANRDMMYYRAGEINLQEKQFAEATKNLVKVRPDSRYFLRARYRLALALAEMGELDKAQAAFEDLADRTKRNGVTDRMHVGALLGKARVLYQRGKFTQAIDAYRDVPRDTEQWHEGLFESTWAMLRDGRFRSAISNFHSLHSSYYEEFYQPESLLLRAIVYLYICRYDEMEKVLDLYAKIYRPVSRDLKTMITTIDDPQTYFRELSRAEQVPESGRSGLRIPYLVAREILHEGDVRRTFNYLANLESERRRVEALPAAWRNSNVGLFVRKLLEKRVEATRLLAGKQIRRHMILIDNELQDLFEQDGFLRFEMIAGKKEALRKEIAGKDLARPQVDDNTEREFYVQNGFEYWPFKGEYWLDEIGNYHYLGVKACE